uniref:roadblock/LC7 domain-containing protein n=1 Tax=Actinacidiphila rubida TaxID=310780 RepID=UPI00396A5FA8
LPHPAAVHQPGRAVGQRGQAGHHGGRVRQTTVAMDDGMLVVMAISDGSLLGLHATAESDMSVVAYHMALFVGRAGHVLTPALRGELSQAMESGR